ncbi:DUF4145 domain-containing protein [Pontibacter kalidii]|uniref:DUF4145 domain-containing protein n=1 Tax=Pontibacter kalidii TaxID=2592049 RepID=UPI0022553184|nr:DUF4145 domain-containing protein [Pontibacter kalidii]
MKLLNEEEFTEYIKSNHQFVLTNDSSSLSSEISSRCDFCQKDAYLKIGSRWHERTYRKDNLPIFATFFIQCPSCKRQSFIQLVVLSRLQESENGSRYVFDYYKLFNLPSQESQFETKDIPAEYRLLKKTVLEAKYALQHSQYMSATIMFRRALQILVKDILGAKGRTLYKELEWLKDNVNALQINLTDVFHDNSSLIRQVGNQGAHPDKDEELQEFSEEDANAVHDLFLLLVNEVFVLPAKIKAMKMELAERRKLK